MNYYVEKTITTSNGQITVSYSGPYTEAEAFMYSQENTYTDKNGSQVCRIITK